MTNNKLIYKFALFGAIYGIIIGSLWHFVYAWSGNNFFVGLIAPFNESVWEHMKLAFFPLLFLGIMEYFYLKNKVDNFFLAHTMMQYFIITFIIAFFYIYRVFTGESLFLDILSFVLGVILGKMIWYNLITKKSLLNNSEIISLVLLIFLGIFFLIADFNPPKIDLFRDPISGTYGINKINQ